MSEFKGRFATHYNRPRSLPEENSGESLTDSTHYVPTSKLIERLLHGHIPSGHGSYYDSDVKRGLETELDLCDPSDSPDFDLADIPPILDGIAARQRKKVEEAEAPQKLVQSSTSSSEDIKVASVKEAKPENS